MKKRRRIVPVEYGGRGMEALGFTLIFALFALLFAIFVSRGCHQ